MNQRELTAKQPSKSYHEETLPFSSDTKLRDDFVNYLGDLRFGKILEELDLAAGKISYKHADGFARDLTIVTASCDRIDLVAPLRSDRDLIIRGQVNHVGSSSMEVGLRIDCRETDGSLALVARAYFIMVARRGEGAARVNPLSPQSVDEQRRYEAAVLRRKQQRAAQKADYRRQAPLPEESVLLHDLYLETRDGRVQGVFMAETQLQSTVIMHPQERNIHHKIFGGYLMRLSFELGWSTAHLYCGLRPLFLNADQFDFYKPVEIGSLVCITSQITFTGVTSFIVEVVVEVVDPRTGSREITNICYFTFAAVDENRRPKQVPKVLPNTYEEGLKYLDGLRRYRQGKELRAKRTKR